MYRKIRFYADQLWLIELLSQHFARKRHSIARVVGRPRQIRLSRKPIDSTTSMPMPKIAVHTSCLAFWEVGKSLLLTQVREYPGECWIRITGQFVARRASARP